MDDVVDITLFRHGVTKANVHKEYLGWTDSPLTREAIQKLQVIKLEEFDLFITSDLGRCVRTMELLFPHDEPIILPELREMNFGMFEGKTYEELKHNELYRNWLDHGFLQAPPDGEAFKPFQRRVEKGWEKVTDLLLRENKKRVFIVTHGGVIRYLLERFSPEKKEFWEWKIDHGNGYRLSFESEQLRRGDRCISLQEVPLTENGRG